MIGRRSSRYARMGGLFVLSVLTACGGGEAVTATSEEPGVKVLEGTVEGWTGRDAVVWAEAYDEEDNRVVLAEVPISADGSFGLSLPSAEGVADALTTLKEKDLLCETDHGTVAGSAEMTPSMLEVASFELTVHPSSSPDGNDEGRLGFLSLESSDGSVQVHKLYAAGDASLRGSCTFTGGDEDAESGGEAELTDTITVDLDLVAGWNDVIFSTDEAAGSTTTVVTTGAVPEGLTWQFYAEDGCESGDCE